MSNIYISENANKIIMDYIEDLGHTLEIVKATPYVYPAVSAHPDIYMCKLGAAPDASIFQGNPLSLGYDYPGNIKYNGVCMGDYFIHNLRHTDSALFNRIKALGKQPINTKQGYTKCNMVVVDDSRAITADMGITRALMPYNVTEQKPSGLCVLRISPGHVQLSGFPYGFLGGASGRIGDQILFNGDLSAHPDFREIVHFIEAAHLTVKYFKEYPLEDIGSIYEETCYNSNIHTS